jgi:hypothetical protein
VAIVGSGHAAFNALLELADLAAQVPDTDTTRVVRRKQVGQLFGGDPCQHEALATEHR